MIKSSRESSTDKAPVAMSDESPELLPRRLIFKDPDRSVVRISPDGTRIAYRAPVDGVLNLWVAPIEDMGKARPVTAVTDHSLGPWIVWMDDNRHVVFFREQRGDENWRAWCVDLRTGDVRSLTPGPGVTCLVQQTSRHFPSELLIAHNERDKRYFDIYRSMSRRGKARWCRPTTASPGISPISASMCAMPCVMPGTAMSSACGAARAAATSA